MSNGCPTNTTTTPPATPATYSVIRALIIRSNLVLQKLTPRLVQMISNLGMQLLRTIWLHLSWPRKFFYSHRCCKQNAYCSCSLFELKSGKNDLFLAKTSLDKWSERRYGLSEARSKSHQKLSYEERSPLNSINSKPTNEVKSWKWKVQGHLQFKSRIFGFSSRTKTCFDRFHFIGTIRPLRKAIEMKSSVPTSPLVWCLVWSLWSIWRQ